MLERAEIAQAGTAVIKHVFAALQETGEVAGQQLLQDAAADAVVEQPVVAAVERPQAAEEAYVVNGDDQRREAEEDKGQHRAPRRKPHQRHDQAESGGERQRGACELQQPDPPRRRQVHGQRVGLDGDAEDALAGVGGLDGAATVAAPARKLAALAFPHDLATPAQLPADKGRRQADHLEPRHGEVPAPQSHEEATVAVDAVHLRRGGRPVVTQLIDEAEAQPDRIGKVDCRRRARQVRCVQHAVGGKREGAIRMAALPAIARTGAAARRRRILRVELVRHVAVDLRRQAALQGAVRCAGQEHIMSFVDARRRKPPLAGDGDRHDRDGSEPGVAPRADLAGEYDDRHDQQQRIAADMIDRQANRRDGQHQHGAFAPSGAG